jgi:hypothetical protein
LNVIKIETGILEYKDYNTVKHKWPNIFLRRRRRRRRRLLRHLVVVVPVE